MAKVRAFFFFYHYDSDAPSNVSDHSDGRLLFRDQHWKWQKQGEISVCRGVIEQDFILEGVPELTWDFHAGVNGSGRLDSGWGVTPVYLVRLCVLSLAVDHGDAQTQTLGKRLGPASERGKLNMAARRGYDWTTTAPTCGEPERRLLNSVVPSRKAITQRTLKLCVRVHRFTHLFAEAGDLATITAFL